MGLCVSLLHQKSKTHSLSLTKEINDIFVLCFFLVGRELCYAVSLMSSFGLY